VPARSLNRNCARRQISVEETLANLDAVGADVNAVAAEYFRTEDIAFAALGDLNGFSIDRNRLDVAQTARIG
jgi:hypothetical protein